nr:unnamed protein product [Callosobruchus analis]
MWPIGGQSDGTKYSCKRASCDNNLNFSCPGPLRVNSPHGVIACKSACLAFNKDETAVEELSTVPKSAKPADTPTTSSRIALWPTVMLITTTRH